MKLALLGSSHLPSDALRQRCDLPPHTVIENFSASGLSLDDVRLEIQRKAVVQWCAGEEATVYIQLGSDIREASDGRKRWVPSIIKLQRLCCYFLSRNIAVLVIWSSFQKCLLRSDILQWFAVKLQLL